MEKCKNCEEGLIKEGGKEVVCNECRGKGEVGEIPTLEATVPEGSLPENDPKDDSEDKLKDNEE